MIALPWSTPDLLEPGMGLDGLLQDEVAAPAKVGDGPGQRGIGPFKRTTPSEPVAVPRVATAHVELVPGTAAIACRTLNVPPIAGRAGPIQVPRV